MSEFIFSDAAYYKLDDMMELAETDTAYFARKYGGVKDLGDSYNYTTAEARSLIETTIIDMCASPTGRGRK